MTTVDCTHASSRRNISIVTDEVAGHRRIGDQRWDEPRDHESRVVQRRLPAQVPAGVEVPRDDDLASGQRGRSPILARSRAVSMNERDRVRHRDLVSRVPGTAAEIDVLGVHPESVAEAAELREHVATHE